MGKKDRYEKDANLLDLIPRRLVEHETDGEGRTVLLIPKFRGSILGPFLQPRLKRPFQRLNLDAFGSFVWERCDGRATVGAIADALRRKFGDAVEPAEERLATFIGQLTRGRLIALEGYGPPPPSG